MSDACIDALESRTLRSVSLDHGVLNITGTVHADTIRVYADPGDLSKIDVKLNRQVSQFERAEVKSLFIRTYRGDDQVFVGWFLPKGGPDLAVPSRVYADAGRDIVWIQGGSAHVFGGDGIDEINAGPDSSPCTIYGENGVDSLVGGSGRDLLVGGEGNDQLYGERGSDTLDGGAGDDALVATYASNADQSDYAATQDRLYGGSGTDHAFDFSNEVSVLGSRVSLLDPDAADDLPTSVMA